LRHYYSRRANLYISFISLFIQNQRKENISARLPLTKSEVTVKVHLTKGAFMSFIAKLKLVTSKRERNLSPIMLRRQKLATKIEEQLELARCQKNGTLYAPKRLKTVTNEAGERVIVETTKRVKEWFWTTPNNKINLSVRYGSKTLELAKGKNAIELSTGDELIATLNLLKDAVVAGELDEAINNASDKLRAGFAK
jgi:hypothetical protein